MITLTVGFRGSSVVGGNEPRRSFSTVPSCHGGTRRLETRRLPHRPRAWVRSPAADRPPPPVVETFGLHDRGQLGGRSMTSKSWLPSNSVGTHGTVNRSRRKPVRCRGRDRTAGVPVPVGLNCGWWVGRSRRACPRRVDESRRRGRHALATSARASGSSSRRVEEEDELAPGVGQGTVARPEMPPFSHGQHLMRGSRARRCASTGQLGHVGPVVAQHTPTAVGLASTDRTHSSKTRSRGRYIRTRC